MLNGIEAANQLVSSFSGIGQSSPLSATSGGFGPDFIVDLGNRTYQSVPGYNTLAQLNAATTTTLQESALQGTQPVPIFSQKQADEVNQIIASAASALAAGRFEEAASKAKELLQRDHNDATGYHLLGRIAATQGDMKTALEHFELAAGLQPDNPRFQDDVFNSRQLRRSDDEVLAVGQELVQHRGSALNGIRLLFELSGRGGDLGKIHLAIGEGFEVLDQAVQQLNAYEVVVETGTQEDLQVLEGKMKQFISRHEPVGLAHSILGRAQQRLGKFNEARASLEQATEIAPDTPRYARELANVHAAVGNQALGQGRFDQAEYRFKLARNLDYQNEDLKFGLAAVRVSKAQHLLDRGLDGEARSLMSGAASLLGDDTALNSEMAGTYLRLGDRAMNAGLTNLALLNYEDALERDPQLVGLARKVAEVHHSLAQDIVDESAGDLSTADHEALIDHYQTAYDLIPTRSSYKTALAEGLNDFGLKLMNENSDYTRAVEMFGRARKLYPDNQTYQDNYNQALQLELQDES